MALTQEEEAAVLLFAERGDVDDLLDAIRARIEAAPKTYPDYFVTTAAVITLRVEGLPEEDCKAYFDDMSKRQDIFQRLRDAVEDTDFYITIDLSDTEVEEATN